MQRQEFKAEKEILSYLDLKKGPASCGASAPARTVIKRSGEILLALKHLDIHEPGVSVAKHGDVHLEWLHEGKYFEIIVAEDEYSWLFENNGDRVFNQSSFLGDEIPVQMAHLLWRHFRRVRPRFSRHTEIHGSN